MKEEIRRLQKDGEYHFEGLSREESRKAAENLVQAAMREAARLPDTKNFLKYTLRITCYISESTGICTHRKGGNEHEKHICRGLENGCSLEGLVEITGSEHEKIPAYLFRVS